MAPLREEQIPSAASVEGKNRGFPGPPCRGGEMCSDWASFHHVLICDPIPVTTWMQGSDRADLEWRVLIGPASIMCPSVTQSLRPHGCKALLGQTWSGVF